MLFMGLRVSFHVEAAHPRDSSVQKEHPNVEGVWWDRVIYSF
jgi:hypothetical protein